MLKYVRLPSILIAKTSFTQTNEFRHCYVVGYVISLSMKCRLKLSEINFLNLKIQLGLY